MFGIDALTGNAHAGATVGAVLLEALILYVGYGALTRLAGPRIAAAMRGE